MRAGVCIYVWVCVCASARAMEGTHTHARAMEYKYTHASLYRVCICVCAQEQIYGGAGGAIAPLALRGGFRLFLLSPKKLCIKSACFCVFAPPWPPSRQTGSPLYFDGPSL
jgi:hypothetical protein